jgi:Chaperone of endosialidase
MPFALVNDPSNAEMSEAINYLLANFGSNLAADPNNGQITGPSGVLIAYLYRYLAVKYADSYDGSVNFSNSPTSRLYYGLRNTDSSTESTNPADYIWYKVTGGFGTTKFLYYQTGGGRQIQFVVATTSPGATYVQESGPAIDLDVVTTTTAYNAASPSIYIWTSTSTPPTRPSTTSTYTWATGAYSAPSGWTTTPTTNTTPGAYLWAITIPLVVPSNTTTSTLDWTNTSYPIYAFSYNGANGTTGGNGISALTAYRVQSQSASPPATPSNTTGAVAPAGWSLTAPSVTVGDVLWYTFGRFNSSSATLDGVPAGQTAWGTPTAASIFQDIRSDNWNGSTPPTYGTPSTYGTQGYYISRTTGNVYFNNGVFRADISTNGDAVFKGDNPTTSSIPVYDSIYYIDYSTLGDGTTSASLGNARAGVLGTAVSSGSIWNAGVVGYGVIPSGVSGGVGIGVVGSSNDIGGYFSSYLSTGVGLVASAASTTSRAFQINQGRFVWGSYSIAQPTGSTSTFLRNDGQWASPSSSGVSSLSASSTSSGLSLTASASTGAVALTLAGTPSLASDSNALGGYAPSSWARIFATNSGTANASGSGVNLVGSTSTGIAGAYVGTSGTSNIVTFTVQTTSPSDVRLKEEIADSDVGLAFVKKLRPVSYKLKADPKHQKGYGFIADEVEQLGVYGSSLVYEEPNWQVGDEVGFKTIHYPSYIAVLTKAIQELSAEIEALKAQLKV